MRGAIRYGEWLLLASPLVLVIAILGRPDETPLRLELPAICVGAVVVAHSARAHTFGKAVGKMAVMAAALAAGLLVVGTMVGAALNQGGADGFESVAVVGTIVLLGTVLGGGAALLFGGAAHAYARIGPDQAPRLALAGVALAPAALLLYLFALGSDWLGLVVTLAAAAWLVVALRDARDARMARDAAVAPHAGR